MAFGIFTIRPKSEEKIREHVDLFKPGKPIFTKAGETLSERVVLGNVRGRSFRRHLANFVLDKNIKGPEGEWFSDRIGSVYELGNIKIHRIAGVFAPGNLYLPNVDPLPRWIEVDPEDTYDESVFCLAAVAKAAFTAVNGLPDARGTDAFDKASAFRQQMLQQRDQRQEALRDKFFH